MPEFERLSMKEISVVDVTEASKRVLLRGTIVGINADDGSLSLDDGTGAIDVFFDNEELKPKLANYKESDRVVVIGWSKEGGIGGEVIRELKGNLNPELKAKVDSMREKNVRS